MSSNIETEDSEEDQNYQPNDYIIDYSTQL